MIDLVKLWHRLRSVAWFLPGFLLWAAFPPMRECSDVLFALAPLMWLSRQGEVKTSVWRWAQSGIFYWLATLSWMPAIIKNNGPWPLVLLGWAGLAAYCTLYFAAYGYLSAAYWRWADGKGEAEDGQRGTSTVLKRMTGILVVEPLAWCGLELVRSRFLGGFAWNQLGVVPVNTGFGAPAALGGVYLCSAVVILINGTVAGIAERVIASVRRRPVNRWRTFETLAAFAVIWGIYSLPSTFNVQPSTFNVQPSALKVALVQRNFPCCFQDEEKVDPVEVYSNLTVNVAALKPDLVVLPESAMSEIGAIDGRRSRCFAAWLGERCGGAAVLAGGGRADREERFYNSAALYSTQDPSAPWQPYPQLYDKVHLVPFGEFIPGDKLIPWLQRFAPVGSCMPGEPKLLMLAAGGESAERPEPRDIPLGTAICFEDTDSALNRRFAAMGAKALVFITNDSWFSNSDEALAHAWQATARAIETGLPVVRVGNSGVTGTIAPNGRANWLVGSDGRELVDRRAAMFDRVELPETVSPYVFYGDWPLGAAFALFLLTIIVVKYIHERKQRRYVSL